MFWLFWVILIVSDGYIFDYVSCLLICCLVGDMLHIVGFVVCVLVVWLSV